MYLEFARAKFHQWHRLTLLLQKSVCLILHLPSVWVIECAIGLTARVFQEKLFEGEGRCDCPCSSNVVLDLLKPLKEPHNSVQ